MVYNILESERVNWCHHCFRKSRVRNLCVRTHRHFISLPVFQNPTHYPGPGPVWLVCNLSFPSFAKSCEKLIKTFEEDVRMKLNGVKTRQPRALVVTTKYGHFGQSQSLSSFLKRNPVGSSCMGVMYSLTLFYIQKRKISWGSSIITHSGRTPLKQEVECSTWCFYLRHDQDYTYNFVRSFIKNSFE